MSVRPQGSVTEYTDATAFAVRDVTGPYHSNDNPYGWFPPNEDFTQVQTAQLILRPADARTLRPGNALAPINVRAILPNVIKTPVIVTASSLINKEKWVDGIYEFNLIYAGTWGVNLLQWRFRAAFIAQACCCIKNLGIEVQDGNCGCDHPKYKDWVRGKLAIEAVISDYGCVKENRTVEALRELKQICERNPCATCN